MKTAQRVTSHANFEPSERRIMGRKKSFSFLIYYTPLPNNRKSICFLLQFVKREEREEVAGAVNDVLEGLLSSRVSRIQFARKRRRALSWKLLNWQQTSQCPLFAYFTKEKKRKKSNALLQSLLIFYRFLSSATHFPFLFIYDKRITYNWELIRAGTMNHGRSERGFGFFGW